MTTNDITNGEASGAATVGPHVVLLTRSVRVIAGMLGAIAGAGLLGVLASLLLSDNPVNPLRLMRLVGVLCVLPGLALVTIRRVGRAVLRIEDRKLVLAQPHRRTEIPIASIAALEPWRVPLPGSGLWLRLQSGRRWRDGIEIESPRTLLDALVDAGGAPALGAVAGHPSIVYAQARSRRGRGSWRRKVLEFPLFALVPTLPLFRVHQIIAYGGTLGEYYQYGLGAYVAAFAIYWATLTIYLALYAAALRVPVELLTIAFVGLAPAYASQLRCHLDRVSAVLYYAGVPALVALRFVAW